MAAEKPDLSAAQRIDKWLWCARFFKTRALASAFCEDTGLRIAAQGGPPQPARKAHHQIRVGDVLTFVLGHGPAKGQARVLRVAGLSERRLSPPLAAALYEDLAPPMERPQPPPEDAPVAPRDPGAGRPTKADRRAIARLKND
ncbi:MAG: RNA-binding S4 domain-containing protein [Alphaproteobacteria bacterium]